MKKNFLRNLAGVLSLALVVTSAAPATAGAATLKTFAVNKSSVVVYLQHAVYKNSFNLDALKLADNALTWTSSNKAVATVSTYGNVVGKKVGTANITLKKAGYAPKVVKVVVKDDAKSVTINNAPAEIAIGDTFDLNATTVGLAGGVSSNAVSYTVDDATIASVSATGVVTPIKAGTIKVTATTKASNGTVTATSAPVSIKIVNKMSAVSQKSLNTISVTFTGVVKDAVKASDFTVKNASTLMIQAVKAVTFSTDGKTAYLELYTDLVNEKSYDVTYNAVTKTLVANAGAPASVTITGKDITFNTATAFDVKLFDANGVEVTSAANLNNLTLTTTKGYLDTANKKITLYSVGDVATVKGVYHTYKYDTAGKEVTFEASANFTAVKAVAKEVSALVGTVTNGTADFAKVNDTVAIGDAGYKVAAKVTYTDATVVTTGLTYESTDSTKLIVGTDGSLLPVAVGVVVVKVKVGDTVLGTVNVTVGAARKATSVSLDKTTISASNTMNTNQVVTITVKDQYNAAFASTTAVAWTLSSSPAGSTAPALALNGATTANNDFTVNGLGATAGTYVYTVTYNGMTQSLQVVVKAPATGSTTTPSSIRMTVAATEKDVKYASGDTVAMNVTVDLYGYDADGVQAVNFAAAPGYTYSVKDADGVVKATGVFGDAGIALRTGTTSVTKVLAVGTYTIFALYNGNVVDTASLKVTDTQVLPVVTQKTNTAVATLTAGVDQVSANSAVIACFEAKMGDTVKAIQDFKYSSLSTGNAILVKTVTVPEVIGGVTVNHVITVNAVVYLQ